jgi:glycosyltransferase involved in cell wall biosynthesis
VFEGATVNLQRLRVRALFGENYFSMLMTVLVPTYKRPDYLERCLAGIESQTRRADEVVIAVREDDSETLALLGAWKERLPLRPVMLGRPGQVFAMNASCVAANGDIISATDDDAVPQAEWLERIEKLFLSDDLIGAVGGRDILRAGGDIPTGSTQIVGRIMPYGRFIGNHHAGAGPLREVDHLKGVNMSWRTKAAGKQPFATDLHGKGAQVFQELAFCFRLDRAGWKVVYDPAILVDHYVAVRFDEDNRAQRNMIALENAAFNFYLSFLRDRKPGWKRFAALAWARLIGIRDMPGIVREAFAILRGDARGKAAAAAARSAWREARKYAANPRPLNLAG